MIHQQTSYRSSWQQLVSELVPTYHLPTSLGSCRRCTVHNICMKFVVIFLGNSSMYIYYFKIQYITMRRIGRVYNWQYNMMAL